jgi:hypothetical protein
MGAAVSLSLAPSEQASDTEDGDLVPLREVVAIVRSKNAGPFRLTLDILFSDQGVYERVSRSGLITAESIAALYRIPIEQIVTFVAFDPGRAIKATLVRPVSSGNVGDGDVYGAQQHAPLLDIRIPRSLVEGKS